jgi:hypothetical protein
MPSQASSCCPTDLRPSRSRVPDQLSAWRKRSHKGRRCRLEMRPIASVTALVTVSGAKALATAASTLLWTRRLTADATRALTLWITNELTLAPWSRETCTDKSASSIGPLHHSMRWGGSSPAARYASRTPSSAAQRSAGRVDRLIALHRSEYRRRAAICSGANMLRLIRNVCVHWFDFALTAYAMGTGAQHYGCMLLVLHEAQIGRDCRTPVGRRSSLDLKMSAALARELRKPDGRPT